VPTRFRLRGCSMPRALAGKPGRQVGPLKEKTVHAAMTKARIHAIVGQVIDELEKRRASGKSDYVAKLADEVQEGGITAWKSLRDLLPRDDVTPNEAPSKGLGDVFIAAVIEANSRANAASPVIDATAEPVIQQASDEVDW
jgi:hypothetical protein